MKINLTYQLNIRRLANGKDRLTTNDKLVINSKPDKQSLEDYLLVLSYYSLAAKNIYNSALFIIKNILTSYQYDKDNNNYKLKNKLHENQKDMINIVNLAISSINKKRINRFNINKSKNTNIKITNNPALFSLYGNVINKNTYYQITNDVLLETTIKLKEKLNPDYQDYTAIHSHVAQPTIQKLCDNYRNYYKALSAYRNKSKNSNFTGKPQEPGYLHKKSQLTFEIPAQRFSNQGKILNILKKHKLYADFEKTRPVNKDLIDNFNSIDLLSMIKQDISNKIAKFNNHRIPENYKLALVRVVPGKYQALPRIEYIITYEIIQGGVYPLLNKISQKKYKKDLLLLKDDIKLKIIKQYYKNKAVPYLATIDCGEVNFATIGFYDKNRSKGLVISSKTFYNHVSRINNKIDNRRKNLMTSDIKQIQSKLDTDIKISKEEFLLLKQFYIAISQDKTLLKLHEEKANKTKNYIHNLSAKIIDDCLKKDINIITIGKNKLWKDSVDRGKKNNRKFLSLPHAQFINYLKYKALLNNILIIETEESYTSNTSFIDNQPLKTHAKHQEDKKDKVSQEITKNTKNLVLNCNTATKVSSGRKLVINIENPLNNGTPFPPKIAIREGTIFRIRNGRIVHADINGSFNIARKVFDNLAYDKDKINMDYFLVEVNLTTKTGFKCFRNLWQGWLPRP